MRCINCGIATGRLRRHVLSSLDMPFQRLLVQWLTIQLPEDGHICHPCFLLLTSEGADTANHRILGHTMVCLGSGRSVRDIRHHIFESRTPLLLQFSFTARLQGITRNYVCHPCWMRTNRQLHQDSSPEETVEPSDNTQNENATSPPPEPPILPPPAVLPPTRSSTLITLPNYKRASYTSAHCIFIRCYNRSFYLIPDFVTRIFIFLVVQEYASHIYMQISGMRLEDIIKTSKCTGAYINFENNHLVSLKMVELNGADPCVLS